MSGWFLTLFWTTGKFLICVLVTRGLVVLHIVTETTFASVRNFDFQFVPPLEFTQWTLLRHTTTTNRGTHVYWICFLVWWNVQPKDFAQSHSFLPWKRSGSTPRWPRPVSVSLSTHNFRNFETDSCTSGGRVISRHSTYWENYRSISVLCGETSRFKKFKNLFKFTE